MTGTTYAFFGVKSFGGITTTSTPMRLLSHADVARCRLRIGPYLVDLARAPAPIGTVEVLSILERNMSALFNLKKRGFVAALCGTIGLRSALSTSDPGAALVLPLQTLRERFIAGRPYWRTAATADEFYLACERSMRETFPNARQSSATSAGRSSCVASCLFSRAGTERACRAGSAPGGRLGLRR